MNSDTFADELPSIVSVMRASAPGLARCPRDALVWRRCTLCGFVVDLTYLAEKPT